MNYAHHCAHCAHCGSPVVGLPRCTSCGAPNPNYVPPPPLTPLDTRGKGSGSGSYYFEPGAGTGSGAPWNHGSGFPPAPTNERPKQC